MVFDRLIAFSAARRFCALEDFDWLAVTPSPIGHAGVKLHWPFDDPAAADGSDDDKLTKFREVRDLIAARIQEWTAELE